MKLDFRLELMLLTTIHNSLVPQIAPDMIRAQVSRAKKTVDFLAGDRSRKRKRTGVVGRHHPAKRPAAIRESGSAARYALHARIFLLGGFVSVENKECLIYFPKLDVAGSIPVARSKSPTNSSLQFLQR
jgi:hypothetical protein